MIFFRRHLVATGWSLFIILSALFMRQLFNALREIATRETISTLIWIAFFGLVIILCVWAKRRLNVFQFGVTLLLFAIALILAYRLPQAEERVHIIKYGILGFLWTRDASTKQEILLMGPLSGLIVSLLDEGLQALLPYRVGDPRDIIINSLSAIWGTAIYAVSHRGKSLRENL